MTAYRVKVVAHRRVEVGYLIRDGDDWDGRPVADKFDASSLAYDWALEDSDDDRLDWQVESVEEIAE